VNLAEKANLTRCHVHSGGQIRYRYCQIGHRPGQIEGKLSFQVDFWRKR
jgi:hypothetical protein